MSAPQTINNPPPPRNKIAELDPDRGTDVTIREVSAREDRALGDMAVGEYPNRHKERAANSRAAFRRDVTNECGGATVS